MATQSVAPASPSSGSQRDPRGRELFWNTLGRLILLYFAPLLLLAAFFHVQYRRLVADSLQAHLQVIAEHQANTFDLFLRERLVNLGNIMDNPQFQDSRRGDRLPAFLAALQRTSDAFLDLGVVSGEGNLVSYVGPVNYSSEINYRYEDWFQEVTGTEKGSVITEIYLGFRDRPHFTIAVRRGEGADAVILRSALSPERLSEYITTLEGASEVHAAIVNPRGILQVATPRLGEVLQPSLFTPPPSPERGFVPGARPTGRPDYAYAWLNQTPWALVVMNAGGGTEAGASLFRNTFFLATVAVFLLMGMVILVRTRQVVGSRLATEQYEAELSGQLVHAAKLASVGELAAGIAHEINNPPGHHCRGGGCPQGLAGPDAGPGGRRARGSPGTPGRHP